MYIRTFRPFLPTYMYLAACLPPSLSPSVHLHPSADPLPLLHVPLLPHLGLSGLPPDHRPAHLQLHLQQSGPQQSLGPAGQAQTHPLQVHSHTVTHSLLTQSLTHYSHIHLSLSLSPTLWLGCSFYTGSGSGFEAFFTNSLILVVAIATKKEFTTLALSDCPLSPLVWVSLTAPQASCAFNPSSSLPPHPPHPPSPPPSIVCVSCTTECGGPGRRER